MDNPIYSLEHHLSKICSDLCDLSIRISSLDVPSFSMALKLFKAQSSLAAAQSSLSAILIELSNVSPSSVPHP